MKDETVTMHDEPKWIDDTILTIVGHALGVNGIGPGQGVAAITYLVAAHLGSLAEAKTWVHQRIESLEADPEMLARLIEDVKQAKAAMAMHERDTTGAPIQ